MFILEIQYLTELHYTFTGLQPAQHREPSHVVSYCKRGFVSNVMNDLGVWEDAPVIHQDGDGEKRCGVDDEYLTMHWSMSLLPDACMIPGKSVFLQAPGGTSLTATVEGVPGLLPGIWEQFLHRCGGEVEEGCYYNRQAQEWVNTP